MVNSRNLDDLLPSTKAKWMKLEAEFQKTYPEADLFPTSTFRDNESQNSLYAEGRTKAGQPCTCGGKVRKIGTCRTHPLGRTCTSAKGGESEHQYRIAIDGGIMVSKKLVWDEKWFTRFGVMAEKHGFRWSGRWKGAMQEMAHIADADFVMDKATGKAKPAPKK